MAGEVEGEMGGGERGYRQPESCKLSRCENVSFWREFWRRYFLLTHEDERCLKPPKEGRKASSTA